MTPNPSRGRPTGYGLGSPVVSNVNLFRNFTFPTVAKMSTNSIHDKVLRYVQLQAEVAIAQRDNYAEQLLNVNAEFNEEGEETLSVEDQRAEIESSLREVSAYIQRSDEYKAFPAGELSTTFCPNCFLRLGVKDTSLDLTEDSDCEIHCGVCKYLFE